MLREINENLYTAPGKFQFVLHNQFIFQYLSFLLRLEGKQREGKRGGRKRNWKTKAGKAEPTVGYLGSVRMDRTLWQVQMGPSKCIFLDQVQTRSLKQGLYSSYSGNPGSEKCLPEPSFMRAELRQISPSDPQQHSSLTHISQRFQITGKEEHLRGRNLGCS